MVTKKKPPMRIGASTKLTPKKPKRNKGAANKKTINSMRPLPGSKKAKKPNLNTKSYTRKR